MTENLVSVEGANIEASSVAVTAKDLVLLARAWIERIPAGIES
jgi:hypothetical protein